MIKDKLKTINRNVSLSFLFTFLQSLGRGIWMGNILSLYIVLFSETSNGIFGLSSNELLGLTAGISGIAMTAIVFPAGWLADKFPRDRILRIAAFAGIASMIILGLAKDIYLIMTALFFWGGFQGLSRPAFESILADSLATGNRSGTYSRLHLVRQFGMAAGPFLNVVLFFFLGDKWDIEILRTVMAAGISVSLLSTIVLFFFKDSESLGDESEVVYQATEQEQNRKSKKIAILLVTSNVLIGMGAGMSIKFFPVFFRSLYDLQPVSVQLIMGATSIFTGIMGIIAQKFSRQKGRGEMIFFVQFTATICLVFIGFYPAVVFLIPLFILRGSLMNAAQPLSRSILMDVVPKRHRGKWNSVETIAWGLFWNASAVIGGFLIGDNNFQRCFFITAGIYVIGTIPILLMIPLVNKEISNSENN